MTPQSRLDAVKDIRPDHRQYGRGGTATHKVLFGDYLSHLREAKQGAEVWWSNLLTSEQKRTGDASLSAKIVAARWPVGPVGHKFVVAVIRQYWLACDTVNIPLADANKVAPEEFLLGWLLATGESGLADFLATIPYWPVGMNAEGAWV